METRPKTILTDLDGTLIRYNVDVALGYSDDAQILPGTKEKVDEWINKGYCIVITTGREAKLYEKTAAQLERLGIHYHYLLMGITGGVRVLINDEKPDGTVTAIAHCLKRNSGISRLDL